MKERFGRCDILVNNAGATRAGAFLDLPDEAWLDGYALKFFGAVRLTRLFWPLLKAAQGHVVNIVGGAGRTPDAEFLIGGSVNAAMANFSKGLVAGSACATASTSTPSFPARPRPSARSADGSSARRRWARPSRRCARRRWPRAASAASARLEDIAALALFLCSERARHIQGTAIAVDGGATPGVY